MFVQRFLDDATGDRVASVQRRLVSAFRDQGRDAEFRLREASIRRVLPLSEIGNIILTCCLSMMANMLKQSFTMSLPEVLRGNGSKLFEINSPSEDSLVVFLYINFSVHNRDIRGYIAMLMDVPSLASVKRLVGEFIAGVMDDSKG